MPDAKFVMIATSLGEGTGGRRAARVFNVQPKVVPEFLVHRPPLLEKSGGN